MGILSLGGAADENDEGMWEAVIKIRNVTKEQVTEALSDIENHQIVDIR
jgi:hypothetical protein